MVGFLKLINVKINVSIKNQGKTALQKHAAQSFDGVL